MLKVTNDAGGVGDTTVNTFNSGVNTVDFTASKTDGILLGVTDTSGILDDLSGTGTITAVVMGWADSTVQAAPPIVYGPGFFPGIWTDLNLSAYTTNQALTLLTWRDVGTGIKAIMREKGDTADISTYGSNVHHYVMGAGEIFVASTTDDSGVLQIREGYFGSGDIKLAAHIEGAQGWTNVDTEVYSSANPPTAWTDLDCSAVVGASKTMVALRLTMEDNLAPVRSFSVRPDGDTGAYLTTVAPSGIGANVGQSNNLYAVYVITETDSAGVIEWIADAADRDVTVDVIGYLAGGAPVTPIIPLSITQTTQNTIELVFDSEPTHIDPFDPVAVTNTSNWTVAVAGAPAGSPVRLIQLIEYIGDYTVRVAFDGPLIADAIYTFTLVSIESVDGAPLSPDPYIASLTAYDRERGAVPPNQPTAASYDLANPQTASTAGSTQTLGTLQVTDDGDFENDTGRASLKKRILRRVTTQPGGFFHMSDYGLALKGGTLLTSTELRRLQIDSEAQVMREPEVIAARATVTQIEPGIVRLLLRVKDNIDLFELSATLDMRESF